MIKMKLLYIFIFAVLEDIFLCFKARGLRVEKIIGGEIAHANQFKYVVAVMYKPRENNLHDQIACTGSIIGDRFIITAAHCFYNKRSSQYNNKEFYIATSLTDLWKPSNKTRCIRVDTVTMPNFYNPFAPDSYFTMGNLAIVKLVSRLGLHQGHRFLNTLRIARDLFKMRNESLTVIGYGWNQMALLIDIENGILNNIQSGKSDGKLRFAQAYLIKKGLCRSIVGSNLAIGNICAKIIQNHSEKKGICQGDSGSPLVHGKYLIGVAINGFSECNENVMPAIYINVPAYNGFITSVLEHKRNNDMRVIQLRQSRSHFKFIEV